MNPKLSTIILTYNREKELRETIESILKQSYKDFEIIIIDNNPEKKLTLKYPKLKYFHQKDNLGVPAGRNAGAEKASGDILVFLDDDVLLPNKDNFKNVIKHFEQDKSLGALAFHVHNFYSKKTIKAEFPHPDLSKQNEEFLVSRFIGCGHSIRKDVFGEGYDKNLKKFWFEELDLCYRIVNEGHKILYCPDIKIIHKQAPSGRLPNEEKYYAMVYNKNYILWKYLPFPYYVGHGFLWNMKFVMQARKNKMYKIYKEASKKGGDDALKNLNVLNKQAIKYLKKTKGRLWY